MNHTLDLHFRKPGPTDLPGPSIAQVMVKSLTNGCLITPECVSLQEFETQIDILQKELNSIRKAGRLKFQTAR
jgi:hypothetical protein